jgi:hypothetical protein
MWVTNARSAALSIITGGGKWVELTIPADSGVLGHQGLQLGLGILMFRNADRVRRKTLANSAQEFEELMSTMRMASIRTRGGSARNRRGGSPNSTQRQNFFSAVRRRCW